MNRKLTINIDNYVKRLKKINFLQPLYEGIINSLDANATEINIVFNTFTIKTEKGLKSRKINGFTIIDNGDGFTETNLSSFFEMMCMDKIKGKLGSGRFIWLKVFDNIKISSKTQNKDIQIDFVKNYDEIKSKETITTATTAATTKIIFTNVSKEYNDKNPEYILKELHGKIYSNLLPKLLLLKNNGKNFKILLDSNGTLLDINNKNIVDLNKQTFKVQNATFDLYYNIREDSQKKIETYYVAHGRQIKKFTTDAQLPDLPNNASATMFLVSKYFNERVNDSRNDFDIDMNNATNENPITFKTINEKLKTHTTKIVKSKFPQIEKINSSAKNKAIDEQPFLASYINENIEDLMTQKEWLKYGKTELEKDEQKTKEDFQDILKDKDISPEKYLEIINKVKDISYKELGRYIIYRQQIIEHLNKLSDNDDTNEDKLHDLFIIYLNKILKNSNNKKQTFNKYFDVNLWLLDDKFMFYNNVFSDESIKNIKKIIKKDDHFYSENNLEPDMSIFYDQEKKGKNIVIVEFKAIKIKNSEAKQKAISIEQINSNIGIIKKEIKDINNSYGFIITKLDEKTTERLKNNDAMQLYSNGDYPYFYFYNKNQNAHIFIYDIRSIIKDADIRNKVFLDLLKKTNKKEE